LSRSRKAGAYILYRIIAKTGAVNRGIIERSDLSGFNWSEIPVLLIEAGFLSNPREDIFLNSDDYQNRIARGIFEGIVSYLMY
jgi:N-acetylmuramoyl-L-alanine amidase